MKIIGITGPTGAGKTTALHALERQGAAVIDCDAVYHQLLEESAPLREALAERFGGEILNREGGIDRKRLGSIVFADPAALETLNGITRRFLTEEIHRRVRQAQEEGRRAAAIDGITLIESGLGAECDTVVAVLAPEEVRIRRIMAREGISEEYACKRVRAQQGEAFFRSHCQYVLENREEEGREAFSRRAEALFEKILR